MSASTFPRTLPLADGTHLLDGAPPPPEHPAPAVLLPAPMLSYACNQQGCCCGGWTITFRPPDLVRLGRALKPEDRGRLVRDIQVQEDLSDDGTPVVTEAYVTDADGRCRFLATDRKRCDVHATAGVEALPDICVDFPVVAYQGSDAAELFYDPVCPSVLDAIAQSDAPTLPADLTAPYADGGLSRRASHVRSFPTTRFGVATLDPSQFATIRNQVVTSLADGSRSPLAHLHAIDSAYAEVGRGDVDPSRFTLRYDRPAAPYEKFFRQYVGAHGTGTLVAVFESYRRFLFAIPHDPAFAAWDELEKHLEQWEHAERRWLQPSLSSLQPLALRYLAHRHFTPFLTIQSRLHFAAGAIVHIFATAQRYAAAFGAVLRRPVDRDIFKAALGCAEYVYRALEIRPDTLPWFELST